MRIDGIKLHNFRSYEVGEFALGPVTFIAGRNNAGKSTLIDAIDWALTGSCRGTDARGVGATALMRVADQPLPMSVFLPMRDEHGAFAVTRSHNGASGRAEVTWPLRGKESAGDALLARLAVSPALIEACLHSEFLLDLHHATAKDLLIEVLDVRVPVGDDQLTLNQVEARYQDAYKQRTERKAAYNAITVPAKPDGEAPDVPAIEHLLGDLRAEEKRLIAAAAQSDGRRGELERQRAEAGRHVSALMATAVAQDLDAALNSARLQLAALTRTEVEDKAIHDHRVGLVDAKGRIKLLADTKAAIETHSPERGCVLDQTIPCKTPAKAFRAQVTTFAGELEDLARRVEAAEAAIASAQAQDQKRAELQARVTRLEAAVADRDRLVADREAALARVAALDADLEALDPEAPEDPALQHLRDRITAGEVVLARARSFIAAMTAHDQAAERKKAAARSLAEAERACEDYGPKGLRAKALTDAKASFEAQINAALSRFGYQLQITVEPWLVLVNGRPAELLSNSERLRVGASLQLALAEVSGFGFVAIDQVDLLDSANRATLAELVALAAEHTQILIAATADDEKPIRVPGGWTAYRLRMVNGVTQVERVAEAVAA